MQTKSRIVGSHAFLFRDGAAFTLPAPGIAGRNARPDALDPAWIDFGIVNNLAFVPTIEEKEVFAPNPGHLELQEVVTTKRKLQVKFDAEQLSFLSFELAFRTLALTAAANQQYNPDAGPALHCWLQVQQYDQDDVLVNTVAMYGYLKVAGELKADENIIKTPLEFLKLVSQYNSGVLGA